MSETNVLQLYCDGACRGNPGLSAIGGVIYQAGVTIEEISELIGMATNNEAEYTALIRGLEVVGRLQSAGVGGARLEIFMDSELVVRQVEGRYKVKNERLRPLFLRVKELLADFPGWSIHHVPRAKNAEADRLANAAYSRSRA